MVKANPSKHNGLAALQTLSASATSQEQPMMQFCYDNIRLPLQPLPLNSENHGVIEAAMSATTGELLWGPVNRTLERFHEIGVIAAGEGYYVEHDKDTNQAYVYNLLTGEQVGGGIHLKGSSLSTLARGGAIAYGKCYIWDFGGYVNAIDLATGTLSWTYVPKSVGYDTPYGINPIWHFGSHSIADGKLFLAESRMYDPPLFPNAHRIAINCTDGSLVWKRTKL